MATRRPLFSRTIPLLRHHLHPHTTLPATVITTPCYTTTPHETPSTSTATYHHNPSLLTSNLHPPNNPKWHHHPDHHNWNNNLTLLVKDILHSDRYKDGQQLTSTDEKMVVEKLLAYHTHSEDKIGCGLDFIMVDRHPQFRYSRCLYVVRTDGVWIDFSYKKCIQGYIKQKYPYAEKNHQRTLQAL